MAQHPVGLDNLTAVLYKVNDLRLEQRPIPQPDDDELLLEMAFVGICGSDVSYLTKGRIGDFVVREPMICGHEASGIVREVGKNVKNFKRGDRVAIEPGVPCRRCTYCKQGNYHLCPDILFCATPPVHGNLTRFYTHAADFCFKLPDNVTLEEGALLEPLSVGVHACRKAAVTLGSKVLISGAGPIGIVTLIVAKAFGASKVIVTDVRKQRLHIAKEFGAEVLLLSQAQSSVAQVSEKVIECLGGRPDKAIDCSGAEFSVLLAIEALAAKGVIVLVGMGPYDMKLPMVQVVVKEIQMLGSFRYANE
ncbi:hypothetical protein RUM44_005872 [Polyplax serrata]|uniref:Sorbitol dehydrogenase n=1 Tax=Polyplax serrata TaxID=468196 RepID=A0ABR1B062_POLSC